MRPSRHKHSPWGRLELCLCPRCVSSVKLLGLSGPQVLYSQSGNNNVEFTHRCALARNLTPQPGLPRGRLPLWVTSGIGHRLASRLRSGRPHTRTTRFPDGHLRLGPTRPGAGSLPAAVMAEVAPGTPRPVLSGSWACVRAWVPGKLNSLCDCYYHCLPHLVAHTVHKPALPGWLRGEESACQAGDAGDPGSIPGMGRPVL